MKIAAEVPARDSAAIARLPIDRVFTMKGFGTVVTGTLVSGTIHKEEELEVFPAGQRLRVRGVQVYGAAAEQAIAGQRTALNLAGISTDDLARGMTLAPPNTLHSTSCLDVSLSLLPSAKPLKDRARVHFHAFTMETIAEVRLHGAKQVTPGGQSYAQLRLAEPTLLLPGDRFILRQFSPVVTIGGGLILDPTPLPKAKQAHEFLAILERGPAEAMLQARIERRGQHGISLSQLIAETGLRGEFVASRLNGSTQEKSVRRIGDSFLSASAYAQLLSALTTRVAEFHKRNPLVAGVSTEELRDKSHVSGEIFSSAIDTLVRDRKLEVAGELAHLPGGGVVMKDDEAESKQTIEQAFASAGLKVPSLKEVLASLKVDKVRAQKIVTLLLREKTLVKVSDDLVFHHNALTDLRQKIVALKSTSPKIDVGRFKDLTGVSRKYAIPLLEYLDRERVTRRVGDERIIL
jgi:selenocysteine-specific elongation factor